MKARDATPFELKVAAVVAAIPRGKVLGYAQVANRTGAPGAARAVVKALKSPALREVPWWRVIRSDGTVAKEMLAKQRPRLAKDGVVLKGRRVPEEARVRSARR
jgi:methylated-DNA-protein-cysteine methyltransferase-like protein